MKRERRPEDWLPLLLGGAALLLSLFWLRNVLIAFFLGTLVWASAWFSLRPRDRLAEQLRRDLVKVRIQAVREQLEGVSLDIRELERLNRRIPDESLTQSLNSLTARAAFLAQEVIEQPDAIRFSAKRPLLVYLPQVVEIAQRYASMQRFGAEANLDMLKRTRQSLKDLILLFDHHIEKLRKAEALDLDVQISVIEKRLQSEGVLDTQSPED